MAALRVGRCRGEKPVQGEDDDEVSDRAAWEPSVTLANRRTMSARRSSGDNNADPNAHSQMIMTVLDTRAQSGLGVELAGQLWTRSRVYSPRFPCVLCGPGSSLRAGPHTITPGFKFGLTGPDGEAPPIEPQKENCYNQSCQSQRLQFSASLNPHTGIP